MFFTAYVSSVKIEIIQIQHWRTNKKKQNWTSLKSYKTEIKILANPVVT